jgi:prepilin-type N-terminal cleavage/methylation domain-containing protein/prepilin-type processing-associated H-X9-DG protein
MKKTAFTLIELLVVISVIALLMAVLLPALGRARKQARAVVCRAHLKQWGTVLALYVQDNEGCLPRDATSGVWLMRGVLTTEGDPNEPELHASVRTEGIACCPMAAKPAESGHFTMSHNSGSIHWQVEGTSGSTFGAWQITRPGPPFTASYGFNRELFSLMFQPFRSRAVRRRGVDTYNVPGKDCIPALFDAARRTAGLRFAFDRPPIRERFAGREVCINRHEGTINGLFLDWSVRSIGLKELWTLKWNLTFDTRGPWTKAGGCLPEDWPEWMRRFKDY